MQLTNHGPAKNQRKKNIGRHAKQKLETNGWYDAALFYHLHTVKVKMAFFLSPLFSALLLTPHSFLTSIYLPQSLCFSLSHPQTVKPQWGAQGPVRNQADTQRKAMWSRCLHTQTESFTWMFALKGWQYIKRGVTHTECFCRVNLRKRHKVVDRLMREQSRSVCTHTDTHTLISYTPHAHTYFYQSTD